jgi:L-alanine-DL-glutamate epimerase-like enolase superfamily enzyme
MKVSVEHVRIPMRCAMEAAWGTTSARELLLVELTDAEGFRGFGEAAPLPGYDGVTIADTAQALQDCRAVLEAPEASEREALLAACAARTVVPQALSAIDLALWDLEGRRRGAPLWQLLGARDAAAVVVNYTIAAGDRAGAAREAGVARADGYRCVKLKVGTGDDAGRLAAVRAVAGPDMAIRLDANGAWDAEQADATLRVLGRAGIECCEEPVHGLDAIEALSLVSEVALAIDETTEAPGALERRRCTAVCLKLGRSGGITGLLDAARRARAAGYEVYLASALDGPLGIAAALHAAVVIEPDRPSGLATLGLFESAPSAPVVLAGMASAPSGPGLGDGLRDWYRSAGAPGT